MSSNYVLNSLFLTAKPTGLGVYSREILKRSVPFFNEKAFDVLLHESAKDYHFDLNHANYLRDETAVNPLKRAMFLNQLKRDFYYSFTHHGSLRPKGKQIITIHDLIPLYFPKQYKSQYVYYKYYLPKLINKSDLVVTISENTKNDLIRHYRVSEDKIKVIYNGYEHLGVVDQSADLPLPDGVSKTTPYLLMVGATYQHKNIHRVLEAFVDIKDKVDLNCVIVGKESPYMDSLKQYVKEKEIENRVNLLGYVSNDELTSLYQHADMFVYPSLYEGFGLPVLEAMKYGIPTISSNTSSLPEVCGDASMLVNPLDVNEMKQAILDLFRSESLRKKLIVEGTHNLERFSWDYTSEEIVKTMLEYV